MKLNEFIKIIDHNMAIRVIEKNGQGEIYSYYVGDPIFAAYVEQHGSDDITYISHGDFNKIAMTVYIRPENEQEAEQEAEQPTGEIIPIIKGDRQGKPCDAFTAADVFGNLEAVEFSDKLFSLSLLSRKDFPLETIFDYFSRGFTIRRKIRRKDGLFRYILREDHAATVKVFSEIVKANLQHDNVYTYNA